MKIVDYSGIKKNGLIIQNFERKGKYKRLWSVLCICGNIFICNPRSVIEGNTKSCGCLTKKLLRKSKTTHGCSVPGDKLHRLYSVWANMLTRCNNPKKPMYYRYGGRGIKVCARWQQFDKFLADNKKAYEKAFHKYGIKTQIDRINNDDDYKPSNCRWVSRNENSNNRSTNTVYIYKNKKYTQSTLAKAYGIHPATFSSRLERGCSIEEALTTPLFCRKHLRNKAAL